MAAGRDAGGRDREKNKKLDPAGVVYIIDCVLAVKTVGKPSGGRGNFAPGRTAAVSVWSNIEIRRRKPVSLGRKRFPDGKASGSQ